MEDFLKLVDQIIERLKSEDLNSKDLFDDVVGPLFKALEPIVGRLL